MKILHKGGVITVCRDDHPDMEGWERIDIPEGYAVTKKVASLEQTDEYFEVFKTIDEIKAEIVNRVSAEH